MATTDYEKYIRTDELLSLQKRPDELSCHDELQFQIVHQASELYMKQVEHELRFFAKLVGEGQIARAATALKRVGTIQRVLLHSIDLLDTMAPTDYMTIRTQLGRGSGQESPGFRMMLKLPGEIVWPAFAAFLEREGKTLREIYDHPHDHHALLTLCEGLTDYDQLLQTWRYRHLMLVYRIIGTGTPSLKGKHSELLAQGLKTRFFPALWDIRDDLFGDWTKAQAAKGSDSGYH